ncbi:uncharacterized protein TM35_000151010, partial [Trypanosoma theileri]
QHITRETLTVQLLLLGEIRLLHKLHASSTRRTGRRRSRSNNINRRNRINSQMTSHCWWRTPNTHNITWPHIMGTVQDGLCRSSHETTNREECHLPLHATYVAPQQ